MHVYVHAVCVFVSERDDVSNDDGANRSSMHFNIHHSASSFTCGVSVLSLLCSDVRDDAAFHSCIHDRFDAVGLQRELPVANSTVRFSIVVVMLMHVCRQHVIVDDARRMCVVYNCVHRR